MRSKKKKEVVYKDTFTFRCFPKYEYTPAQKARLVLFQGRIEHWRAAVNYADRFDNPNKINLLYMIGYSDRMRAAVQKTKNNVVILCAKIPSELLQTYEEYWSLIDHLKKCGDADDNGNLSRLYLEERRKNYEYGTGRDECVDRMVERFRKEEQVIQAYQAAIPQINKYYERFTIIDKLHPEKTIAHKDLDKIIKRYFPFGREQCGISNMAYKSIALIDKAVACGLGDEDGVKLLKMPNDPGALEVLRKNIKRCDMYVNTALRECGHIDLQALFEKMNQPPYGWGRDAHAAFCFARAMRNHLEHHWGWDTYMAFPAEDCLPHYISSIVKGRTRRHGEYILFNEDGWHLCDRLAYMFGVKSIRPLPTMLMWTRVAIEKHTRMPVDIIDHRLNEMFCNTTTCDLIDSGVIKELTKYYTWDRCEQIRQKYQTINEDVAAFMREKLPGITDVDLRASTVQCSGWLWDRRDFYETAYTHYKRYGGGSTIMRIVGVQEHDEKIKRDLKTIFGIDEGWRSERVRV